MKKYKYILILIIFILVISTIPSICNLYYQRERYVKTESLNLYDFEFISHWKQVADVLDLNENTVNKARIENLDINYRKDGKINKFRYEVTWRANQQLLHASINFDKEQKKFIVSAFKTKTWIQFDQLTNVDSLFEILDKTNIKDITSKKEYSYYGLSNGRWDATVKPIGEIYSLLDNKIVPFKKDISLKSDWIRTYGMNQESTDFFSSAGDQYFIYTDKSNLLTRSD